MTITYTKHALARMAERGISQREVEATLKNLLGKYPPTMAELSPKVSLKDLVTNSYFES
jgi:hypothetical protein